MSIQKVALELYKGKRKNETGEMSQVSITGGTIA